MLIPAVKSAGSSRSAYAKSFTARSRSVMATRGVTMKGACIPDAFRYSAGEILMHRKIGNVPNRAISAITKSDLGH